MASLEVDVHDHAGGDHRQTRDIFLIPGEFVWVRDRIQLQSEESLQVGPLWHVRDVAESGDDWAVTRTLSTRWNRSDSLSESVPGWIEAGPPRSMLVVLPSKAGVDNGHVLDAADTSGRPHCLFQRWHGEATAGTSLGFNSCLVLRPDQGKPDEIRSQVDVVYDDDRVAILRFRDWILIDNPDGRTIRRAGIVTDYRLAAVRMNETGDAAAAAGLRGTLLEVENELIVVESP